MSGRIGSFRPHAGIFGAVLAATLVGGWIDVHFAVAMTGASKDFYTFYDATRAFVQHRDMYASGTNLNPPHFYVLLLPLAALSREHAWAAWCAANLVALVLSVRVVVRELQPDLDAWGWCVVCAGIVCAPATSGFIITGQLSWLLMWPVTAAWAAARRGRWALAGALVGAVMSIKLFLLVIPLYLLITRRTRAALVATVIAGGCVISGLILVGSGAYRQWIASLAHASWAFLPMNASALGFLTRALSTGARPFFEPVSDQSLLVKPLWVVVATGVSIAGLGTASRTRSVDLGFGLLLVTALLVSPLGWIYYAWVAVGPLAAVGMSLPGQSLAIRRTFMAGLAALFVPIPALEWMQPRPWATITIGSLYFWGMVGIWVALVVIETSRGEIEAGQTQVVPSLQAT